MQKTILEQALDLLINHEQEKASALLHEWIVEQTKIVHESIMQDETVSDEIESDIKEIEAEEMYGESAEDDEGDAEFLDGSDEPASEDQETEDKSLEDRVLDVETDVQRLNDIFNKLVDIEEKEHGMDIDGDGVIAGEEDMSDGDVQGDDLGDGNVEDVIDLDDTASDDELNKIS